MVHALDEIHRTLKTGGILIDMRPVEDNWRVEVVSAAGYESAGRLSDQPIGIADDEAAFKAIREAETLGWFKKLEEKIYDFFYYWDTPSEMKEFMDEEWADFEKMEEDLYRKAASIWTRSNADARPRVRVKMHIAKWIK